VSPGHLVLGDLLLVGRSLSSLQEGDLLSGHSDLLGGGDELVGQTLLDPGVTLPAISFPP